MTAQPAPKRLAHLLPLACTLVLCAATILIPLVILPFGESFLLDSKTLFFFAVGLIVFSIWATTAFLKKTVQFTFSPFLFPAVLLLVSTLLSGFLNAIYPINQFVGFGALYLTFSLILILAPSLIPEKFSKYFAFILVLPAILLALASAAELFHAGPSIIVNTVLHINLPNSPLFSLSGAPLLASQVLVVAFVGALTLLITGRNAIKPFSLIATAVILGGLIINIQVLFQQKVFTDVLLPMNVSWSVAADTLKSLKATVIGVGPENYQQTYLLTKPAFVNIMPIWSLQFTQGSNLPLTVIVTHGLLGLSAWIWLAVAIVRWSRKTLKKNLPLATMALATLAMELLSPPNITLLSLQCFILVFWIISEKDTLKDVQVHAFTVQLIKSGDEVQKVPKHSQFLVYLIAALSAVCIAIAALWFGRIAISQYQLFRAALAISQNDALSAYTHQQRAVIFNPYSDAAHRSFSHTNLAIAEVLVQNKELSEQDKQQAVKLIEQAIQEARMTVDIEPNNSVNWVLIARTYSNLVGGIKDAETLAVTAYLQAVALAPNDPTINLELGSLYYRLGQYPKAVQQLEKTAQLKPDMTNAFYNLANAYRQNNQLQASYDTYEETLKLLPAGDDYNKVKGEQDDVKKLIDATKVDPKSQVKGEQTEAVSAPAPTAQPVPSPSPSPSLEPSPSVEVNPSVQPVESPSPEPSPSL
jgi:Tfp pilus assembly protein PilF